MTDVDSLAKRKLQSKPVPVRATPVGKKVTDAAGPVVVLPSRQPTKWRLVQNASDLPNLRGIKILYADVETTSGSVKRGGLYPYSKGDRICGYALTVDDAAQAWYLPVRHTGNGDNLFLPNRVVNLDPGVAARFMQDALAECSEWWNHRIKFDAHFFGVEGIDFDPMKLRCSLELAKVVDCQSQRWGYELKPFCESKLGIPQHESDAMKAELARIESKNYADVHPEIAGKYACGDVARVRRLREWILANRYEGDEKIWEIETKLTGVLYRIERRGMRIDREKVALKKRKKTTQLGRIERWVKNLGAQSIRHPEGKKWAHVDFRHVDLGSTKSVLRHVIEPGGLPIVEWNEDAMGNQTGPSVSYEAIKKYQELPLVLENPALRVFFTFLEPYRELSQFISLYCEGWLNHIDGKGFIRPFFNQVVRTGRMSCTDPNFQQLNKEAKELVVPDEAGWAYLSRDYSQVEYRFIGAITRAKNILKAYRENPDVDFHDLVTNLVGTKRRDSKVVNFGVSFGMGEAGLVAMLAASLGGAGAEARAKKIYDLYHGTFPEIKRTSAYAERLAKQRGYIRTLFGRRRSLRTVRLPNGQEISECRKAFPSAVQGSAADLVKDRLIAWELHPDRPAELSPRGVVHDEIPNCGPAELLTPKNLALMDSVLTECPAGLDMAGIPFRVDGGSSTESWRGCGD